MPTGKKGGPSRPPAPPSEPAPEWPEQGAGLSRPPSTRRPAAPGSTVRGRPGPSPSPTARAPLPPLFGARPPEALDRERHRVLRKLRSTTVLIVIALGLGLLLAVILGGLSWAIAAALHHASNN